MSGGHFDYEQYRIQQAADDLNNYIAKVVNNEFEDDWKPEYSQDTLNKFKVCAKELERVATMLHHIDYLICSDYSEKRFKEFWKKDFPEDFEGACMGV